MKNACPLVSAQRTAARLFRFPFAVVLTSLILRFASPQSLWAQIRLLEDPASGSAQSGIALIRGWACEATLIEIQIDNNPRLRAAYGTTRGDTQGVCGDDNNGFGLTFNWNLAGDGEHRVRAFADGVQFADVTFTVTTLGGEFLRGLSGTCTASNFPQTGSSVDVVWQESIQNFVIVRGSRGGSGNPGGGRRLLEDPASGSAQSGIALIRGWACEATLIEIQIDNNPRLRAAYGTTRGDTQGVCGDDNNGFGLTFNWNLAGDGEHRVRAFADGVQFADVTFTVTTLGGEFLRGLSGTCTAPNFPQAGTNVTLRWQESIQNFVIAGAAAGSGPVGQGLSALAAGDLRAANESFSQAAAADPNDARANLYLAVTRVAAKALDDPRLASLATRSGVTSIGDSRNVCGLRVTFPQTVPSGGAPRTGEILDTLRGVLLPEVDAALGNLSRLSDAVNIAFDPTTLPACLRLATPRPPIEVDRGDTLALTATLQAARALFDILAAYNFDVDLPTATERTPQEILAAAPALLTLRSGASLGTAHGFVDQALASLSLATTSVLAETDDQANDLLIIVPQDRAGAERTRRILDLVRQSLQGQVVLPIEVGLPAPERLDLSLFFSARFSTLRPFLPAFDAQGDFDFERFPDPTFGGSAPDLTQQDINNVLDVLCPPLSGRISCQREGL